MTREVDAPTGTAAEVVLRATALRLAYGDHVVLDGVDIEVRQGEFWFLVGPNGEGKTTFLLAALGLARPTAGAIRRFGPCAPQRRVGFVPQRCDLNPSLPTTVREFVGAGFVGIGLPRRERAARLALALERAGLRGLARRRYWSLSGGQRQRALVARALVRDPALLIVDEPTSGLDISAEDALMEAIAALNAERRMTVLFVTHDLALAARYASHVALFHAGRVTWGPSAAILTDEHLHGAYGCSVEAHGDLLRAASAKKGRTGERTP